MALNNIINDFKGDGGEQSGSKLDKVIAAPVANPLNKIRKGTATTEETKEFFKADPGDSSLEQKHQDVIQEMGSISDAEVGLRNWREQARDLKEQRGIVDSLGQALDDAGRTLGEVGDDVGGGVGKVVESGTKGVENVTGGYKNLLSGLGKNLGLVALSVTATVVVGGAIYIYEQVS